MFRVVYFTFTTLITQYCKLCQLELCRLYVYCLNTIRFFTVLNYIIIIILVILLLIIISMIIIIIKTSTTGPSGKNKIVFL